MPVSPKHILTDVPHNNALLTTCESLNPVKLTPTIKHYLALLITIRFFFLYMVSIDKLAVANKVQNATKENEGPVKRLIQRNNQWPGKSLDLM